MKIDMKLDRITITGGIYGQHTSLNELIKVLNFSRWEQISDSVFILNRYDNFGKEFVAGLYANKFQKDSWRLDTSNHLKGDELSEILIPLNIMEGKHLTRIDVAFDIINGYLPNMSHKIYKFGSGEREYFTDDIKTNYYGRSKKLQTMYVGSRKSEKQVRYYDKLVERKFRKQILNYNIKKWERLELQLRGNSIDKWKLECKKMLSYFKMPNYRSIENVHIRSMLYCLDNHIVDWNELSTKTRSKFRNLIRSDFGFNDEYSQLLLKYFDDNCFELQDEINNFFKTIY